MASGWAGDDAVNNQIQDSVADEVMRAISSLPHGESYSNCMECGSEIPEKRKTALPGVRLCISCQNEFDKCEKKADIYNRRGSKDSQLR